MTSAQTATATAAAAAALRLFVAIDARRPASWVCLAAGAVVGWSLGRLPAAGPMSSAWPLLVAAAVVGVIGDLPLDLLDAAAGRGRRGRRWAVAWAVERAAWPLAGFAAGLPAGGAGDAGWHLLAACAGGIAAALTVAVARLAGAKSADAASLVLAISAGSGAAAIAAPGARTAALAATGAWLAGGGLVWASTRGAVRRPEPIDAPLAVQETVRGTLGCDPLPAGGPLRRVLERLAMGSALLGMAGWLVLEPDHAGSRLPAAVAWGGLSLAWLVALVVPAGTLQDGVDGSAAWERLFRAAADGSASAAGAPRARWRSFGTLRPGPVRFAARGAFAQAAVLAWPPLVCGLVTLPTADRAVPPAVVVVALACAAVMIATAVAVAAAVRSSRETAFACVVAAVVVLVAGAGSRIETAPQDAAPSPQPTGFAPTSWTSDR